MESPVKLRGFPAYGAPCESEPQLPPAEPTDMQFKLPLNNSPFKAINFKGKTSAEKTLKKQTHRGRGRDGGRKAGHRHVGEEEQRLSLSACSS